MTTTHPTLGARLRALRERTGCTVAEIAAAAEVSSIELKALEDGRAPWPRLHVLERLARVYGVSLDDLTSGGQP